MGTELWRGQWRGRSPAGDAHKRSRRVINSSGGIMRGKFPSRKNGRIVHHEGMLELDAIYLFEASPKIAIYREQPAKFEFPDGDTLRRYTPDFELRLTSGAVVWVEIKPLRFCEQDEIRHRLSMVASHMRRRGRDFGVLTDETLQLEPRQTTIRTIWHRAPRISVARETAELGVQRCAEQLPAPLIQASDLLRREGLDVYSLLLQGLLRCSLDRPIGPSTLITTSMEADDGWFRISQEFDF